jgi:catechol 2,3-dioxygenase-like lactoylglutathione lyase family enzyme
MTARGIGFIGVRIADADAYGQTVALYRDALGMTVTRDDGDRSVRFILPDGTALHVYGPGDVDHVWFGEQACVGLSVDDVQAIRRALEGAGIELLDDIEEDDTDAWFHYRAPDGSVQEVIGPRPRVVSA